jgi:hypothetical protein
MFVNLFVNPTPDLELRFNQIKKSLFNIYLFFALSIRQRNCNGTGRHDTQHNGIQHNNTQHNDIQRNNTQHNDIQHYNTQHNDIQRNNTQHNDMQYNDIQHNNKSMMFSVTTCSTKALNSVRLSVIMPNVVMLKLGALKLIVNIVSRYAE